MSLMWEKMAQRVFGMEGWNFVDVFGYWFCHAFTVSCVPFFLTVDSFP